MAFLRKCILLAPESTLCRPLNAVSCWISSNAFFTRLAAPFFPKFFFPLKWLPHHQMSYLVCRVYGIYNFGKWVSCSFIISFVENLCWCRIKLKCRQLCDRLVRAGCGRDYRLPTGPSPWPAGHHCGLAATLHYTRPLQVPHTVLPILKIVLYMENQLWGSG